MRSVEVALASDYARRGLWIIPVVLLSITALPLWLYAAFRHDGGIQPGMREAVVLHVTLTLVMGAGAAISVFQAHGKLARHFRLPISSARLVACQMGLGMLTVVAMYVIAAGTLNLGGNGWPVVGPAMFLAASLACSLAVIWSLEGSIVAQLIGMLATTFPLIVWFNRNYGARIMGDWQHMWSQPTAGDALALGGLSLVAYGAAVLGVSRVRRGDTFDFSLLIRWWEQLFENALPVSSFHGPHAAQGWFEWRQKLTAVPAILMAAFQLLMLALWANGYMETKPLLGSQAFPLMILVVVMPLVFGLVTGICSQESGKPSMRYLIATRPVTDTLLAFAILRNCLLGLLMSWGTWLASFGMIVAVAWWADPRELLLDWPLGLTVNNVAAVGSFYLLVSWTITTLMATLVATGRAWLIVAATIVLFGLIMLFSLLKQIIPPAQFEVLFRGWLLLSGGLFLGGTIVAFAVAFARRLISLRVLLPSLAFWLLAVAVLIYSSPSMQDPAFLWQCCGFLSLSVAPFAAMPLAIHFNRHR